MRKVYTLIDEAGREMKAEMKDGELKVTMTFYPEKESTIEEVCDTLGWTVVEVSTFDEPKVIKFDRKDFE